ncbi:MAG: hypothetical protein NZO58_05095, partial [Gemmataceae bacterium]|nr:hypothetical protein [Gemmataceae bacterium]
ETYPRFDPTELTDADLDDDQLDALGAMLTDLENGVGEVDVPEAARRLRYDLCSECHRRFLRDPLAKEQRKLLHFSKN